MICFNKIYSLEAILILCIFTIASLTPKNNVCKSWLDYAFLPINPNCWYNPDVNSNTVDMVNRNGYPLEMYSLKTEDGYILSLYRIPHNNNKTVCFHRQPVLIQHGFVASSDGWVDTTNKSLAFFLVNRCFDVWLGNFRGTPHSQNHVKYSVKDPRFWNHSFHEMGIYDLPAMLDFIRTKTIDRCKIIYIGHSMGTTASYIYAILRPEGAERNLAGLISLAPVAYTSNTKSALRFLAPYWKITDRAASIFGIRGLFADHFRQQATASLTCQQFYFMPVCVAFIFINYGAGTSNFLAEDLPVFFSYYPSASAVKSAIHFGQQIAAKGRFQYYDYENNNINVYGTISPPEYDVTKISLPVHLMYGKKDVFADQQLYNKLQTTKSITSFNYNHIGFNGAKDVEVNLYLKLLDIMGTLTCKNYS